MDALGMSRPVRPWYGTATLVAALLTAMAVLGVTLVFWVDQVASSVSIDCFDGTGARCRVPSWLAPAQWVAWIAAVIAAAVSLVAAAREAESGERRQVARVAILPAITCSAFVLVTLFWSFGSGAPD